MKNHFPDPQKGKIRIILILVTTGLLPLGMLVVLFWAGITDWGLYQLIPLGLVGLGTWTIIHLFKGKEWAHIVWVLVCLFTAFFFLVLSIGLAFSVRSKENWVFFIPFLLMVLYAVLGFSLYKNYHIEAYLKSRESEDMLEKIEELGNTSPN